MKTTSTPAAQTFAPVTIGTTPAGVEWVAYKPEHVAQMRARLAAMRERAYPQNLTVWARGNAHPAQLCGTVDYGHGARPVYLLTMKTCKRVMNVDGSDTTGWHAWNPHNPADTAITYLDNAAGLEARALRY